MLSLCAEANLLKLKNIKRYLNIGDATLVDIFPSKVGNILVIISVVNHTPLKVTIPILPFLFSCLNQINKTNIPMSSYFTLSKS